MIRVQSSSRNDPIRLNTVCDVYGIKSTMPMSIRFAQRVPNGASFIMARMEITQ